MNKNIVIINLFVIVLLIIVRTIRKNKVIKDAKNDIIYEQERCQIVIKKFKKLYTLYLMYIEKSDFSEEERKLYILKGELIKLQFDDLLKTYKSCNSNLNITSLLELSIIELSYSKVANNLDLAFAVLELYCSEFN